MIIEKKLITSNNQGAVGSNNPKYIVIHDTGNSSKGAGALNHYKWLNNNNDLGRSAHIFVDDKQALQVIDYDRQAYHTGVKYIDNVEVPACTNSNSIGIEFCVNKDGNLEQTLINLAWVVVTIQNKFNIPHKNIITHQMASGKQCPKTFIDNPKLYEDFKTSLVVITGDNIRFIKAINVLVEENIISSPDYWKQQQDKNIQALILKMYDYINKVKKN